MSATDDRAARVAARKAADAKRLEANLRRMQRDQHHAGVTTQGRAHHCAYCA